jgi:hypothetical protein
MWARAVEVMLGLWLVIAPFVFGHFGELRRLAWSDMASGAALVLLSSLCFFERLRRLHLLNLAVSAWLVLHGYLGYAHPAPPGAQNEILVGLVLLLTAIIPPQSSQPPRPWRQLFEEQARAQRSQRSQPS